MKNQIVIAIVSVIVNILGGDGCASQVDPDNLSGQGTVEAIEPTGTSVSALGGPGSPCNLDSECTTGVCNTFIHQCANKANNGSSCNRDFECLSGICNLALHVCANKANNGSSCSRDFECLSGICNMALHVCANKANNGSSCLRGVECLSGFCNSVLHVCT